MSERLDLPARGWVPSAREGEVAPREGVVPTVERVAHRRPSLSAFISSLNPRAVTAGAPLLPLLVFTTLAIFGRWEQDAVGILAPQIRSDFALSTGLFVFIVGTGPVLGLLIAPVMGWWADRHSRLRMLRVGAPVHHLATAAIGLAHSLPVLFIAPLVSAAGASAEVPAALPLLTDYYPLSSRARVFYFVGMGSALALAAPLAAATLDIHLGWRTTLLVVGIAVAVVSLSLLKLKEPVRGLVERVEQGVPAADAATPPPQASWSESWRAAWSIGTVRRVCYAIPFLVAASVPIHVYLLLYFADVWRLDVLQRGELATGAGVAGVIGLAFSGTVTDRLLAHRPGRIFTYLGGLLVLSGACTVLLALSGWLWLAIATYLPIGAFGAVLEPSYKTLISRVVPVRVRAFGLTVVSPWALLGFALLPIVFSFTGFGLDERTAILIFSVFHFIGAVLIATAGGEVERDIRAAAAATEAEAAMRTARGRGRDKLLVCRALEVAAGGTQILAGVDLDLDRGELVALMGTNGAGKSTLLRAIVGLQQATGGAVFYDGRDITHRPADENARDGIVFMPGGRAIFPTLSVEENLRLAGPGNAVSAALERFPELRPRLGARAGTLSGGEQQMVALMQALLMKPRLLMIDELSLGLAPQVVERLLEIVREINQQETTVLLVEQSLNVALSIARRGVFMERGRVLFDGAMTELTRRPDLVRSVLLAGAAGGPKVASGGLRARREIEGSTVLSAAGVAVSFGGVEVLRGVDVTLAAGEVVGIIGPNGAGKTTLFDVLSGYVRPDAGEVMLGGRRVTGLGPDARARRGLGRSFQNARLFSGLTVRDCVAVALEKHLRLKSSVLAAAWAPPARAVERRAMRRVDTLLELLNLEEHADKFVSELSTGLRRLVDVACVMASEPKALLLDEPSSGLAQSEVEMLGPLVRRLAKDAGCGVLIIEHDIPLVTGVSDRLVAMELGRVLAEGDPEEVANHPEVVRAYLGASEVAINRSGILAGALQAAGLPEPEAALPAGRDIT